MHFYTGLPISLYYFAEDGKVKEDGNSDSTDFKPKKVGSLKLRKVTLGPGGPDNGEMFHATITKNTWFTRILDKNESISGNTVKFLEGM